MDIRINYTCYHEGKFCSNGYVYCLDMRTAIAVISKWNIDGRRKYVYAVTGYLEEWKPENMEYNFGKHTA